MAAMDAMKSRGFDLVPFLAVRPDKRQVTFAAERLGNSRPDVQCSLSQLLGAGSSSIPKLAMKRATVM